MVLSPHHNMHHDSAISSIAFKLLPKSYHTQSYLAMQTEMSCAQRASWATLVAYFPVKNANIPVIKMARPLVRIHVYGTTLIQLIKMLSFSETIFQSSEHHILRLIWRWNHLF